LEIYISWRENEIIAYLEYHFEIESFVL